MWEDLGSCPDSRFGSKSAQEVHGIPYKERALSDTDTHTDAEVCLPDSPSLCSRQRRCLSPFAAELGSWAEGKQPAGWLHLLLLLDG